MEISVNRKYILPLSSAKEYCPATIKIARYILNGSTPYKDKEKKSKAISARELSAAIGLEGSKLLLNKHLQLKNELEHFLGSGQLFKAVYYQEGIYTFFLTDEGILAGDATKYHIHYDSSVWKEMDSSYSVLLYEALKDLAADSPEPVLTITRETFPELKLTRMSNMYRTIKRAVEQVNKTDLTIVKTSYSDEKIEISASI